MRVGSSISNQYTSVCIKAVVSVSNFPHFPLTPRFRPGGLKPNAQAEWRALPYCKLLAFRVYNEKKTLGLDRPFPDGKTPTTKHPARDSFFFLAPPYSHHTRPSRVPWIKTPH